MKNKEYPDECHKSHNIRCSVDSSFYDFVCKFCGSTDITGSGWGKLKLPCKKYIEE